MQYFQTGGYLGAAMVTGPGHNLLQVRLGTGAQGVPAVERLPPVGGCTHDPLDEPAIVAQVLQGVAKANAGLGTRHTVTHIRYVANDTGPEVAYGVIAARIISHLESGGEFVAAGEPAWPATA